MTGFTHESPAFVSLEWYTPPEIFDALGLRFDLDPASPGADVVPWIPADKHLTIATSGLHAKWYGRVWLNPPYGRWTAAWLYKLVKHGNGVALVFARTDTEWFQRAASHADAICFLKQRVKFIKADGTVGKQPGCGSMLLAFGDVCAEAVEKCELGVILKVNSG